MHDFEFPKEPRSYFSRVTWAGADFLNDVYDGHPVPPCKLPPTLNAGIAITAWIDRGHLQELLGFDGGHSYTVFVLLRDASQVDLPQ